MPIPCCLCEMIEMFVFEPNAGTGIHGLSDGRLYYDTAR